MVVERTLVLIKPDGVQRSITGEVITRFERVGLKIVGMKMVWADKKFAEEHYEEHKSKPFFKGLTEFIRSGPVVAMVVEGLHAPELVKKMVGATEPRTSAPGTIRGDYSHHSYAYTDKKGKSIANIIHASADSKDAKREIALWFDKKEIHSYKRSDEDIVF